MKIIFIDKNKSLVSKIRKAVKFFPEKINVKCGDIFKEDGIKIGRAHV